MSRFSVTNMFNGVNEAARKAMAPIALEIFRRLEETRKGFVRAIQNPIVRPIGRILYTTGLIYRDFKSEIRTIARTLSRFPGALQNYLKREFSAYRRAVAGDIKGLLKPAFGDVFKIKKSLGDHIKAVATFIKDATNPKKFTDRLNTTLLELVRKPGKKNFPSGFIDLGIAETVKFVKKTPVGGAIVKYKAPIVETITVVAKNADSVGRGVKQLPKILGFLEPFLKASGKGGKSLFKALPIVGEFWQAIDQELINGEIKAIQAQVKENTKRSSELYQLTLTQRASVVEMRKQLTRMEQRMGGGGNNASVLTQTDLNRISQTVNTAVKNASSSGVNQNALASQISQQVTSSLRNVPQGATPAQVQQAVNSAVAGIPSKTATLVQQRDVTPQLARIEAKIPTATQVSAETLTRLQPLLAKPVNVDFSPIAAQITQINSGVGALGRNQNTIFNQTTQLLETQRQSLATINQINAKPAPQLDLSPAISEYQRGTQLLRSQIIDNHAVTRQHVTTEVAKAKPALVDVPAVARAVANESGRVNNQAIANMTATALKPELERVKAVADTKQLERKLDAQKEKVDDSYKLLGGDALKNGLRVEGEKSILQYGTQMFGAAAPVVASLPAMMLASQAPAFFRNGLHRLPANLPVDAQDASKGTVQVTDKLGHSQQLWKLADQKTGSPSTISLRNADGQITKMRSRNVHESLDTITAQNMATDSELEVLQQAVIKLAAETVKVNMIVLQNNDVLDSIRDFLGFRYTETKKRVPTELSLGKQGLLDWLKGSTLHYVGSKMDQRMDLSEMMQKQFLETGKISSSFFQRFDPSKPDQKIVGENFSKPATKGDDDEWKKFVKFVKETPAAVKDKVDPTPDIKRYTNNDTVNIDVAGTTLPTG